MNPKISVIMPVHNTEKYLEEAINSILNQSFSDFEFIIIDDGSSDHSPQILEKYCDLDKRIQIITNLENQGVIASLNRGLKAAIGTYIARMDADDISTRDRFEKQVNYLDAHPQVGLLGCSCNVIDQDGQFISLSIYPQTDIEIRWHALFHSPFCHPGIMLRKNILGNHVYPDRKHAEDFALWSIVLPQTRAHNLTEPYLNYRRIEKSVSIMYAEKQQQIANEVAKSNINALMESSFITNDECIMLRMWNNYQSAGEISLNQINTLRKYISIYKKFTKTYQPETKFNLNTKNRIYDILNEIKTSSEKSFSLYSKLAYQALRLSPKHFVKFILSKE